LVIGRKGFKRKWEGFGRSKLTNRKKNGTFSCEGRKESGVLAEGEGGKNKKMFPKQGEKREGPRDRKREEYRPQSKSGEGGPKAEEMKQST